MPNTPAAIGRGITVAVPNPKSARRSANWRIGCSMATGAVEWIDDEALMDAVTAVSGSGPAYVFLLAESLARAGAAAGLPGDLAERLARATVAGSGELLHLSPLAGRDPARERHLAGRNDRGRAGRADGPSRARPILHEPSPPQRAARANSPADGSAVARQAAGWTQHPPLIRRTCRGRPCPGS